MPVYNVEHFLPRCLDSVLAQTHREIEVVVVNDGSSDQSLSICNQYAIKDQRVRVVDKPNGGLSDARNAGIAHATGDYLAFVDGDDYLSPDFIAKLLVPFQRPETQVSVCAFYLTTQAWQDYEICHVKPDRLISGRDLIAEMLRREDGGHYVIACNKLYRQDVFATVRYDVGRHYEDDFISARLFYDLDAITVIDEPLYHYVQRDGSIMQSALTDTKAADYVDLCLEKIAFFTQRQDQALVIAAKQKLLYWAVDEATRSAQSLSPQMKQRIQQTYRQLYTRALCRGDLRFQVLGFMGNVDLRTIRAFRSLVQPFKRLVGALRH
ncbi:glycosyltransferase family 2 protein [Lacticaseibacillus sp. GG6-2]